MHKNDIDNVNELILFMFIVRYLNRSNVIVRNFLRLINTFPVHFIFTIENGDVEDELPSFDFC